MHICFNDFCVKTDHPEAVKKLAPLDRVNSLEGFSTEENGDGVINAEDLAGQGNPLLTFFPDVAVLHAVQDVFFPPSEDYFVADGASLTSKPKTNLWRNFQEYAESIKVAAGPLQFETTRPFVTAKLKELDLNGDEVVENSDLAKKEASSLNFEQIVEKLAPALFSKSSSENVERRKGFASLPNLLKRLERFESFIEYFKDNCIKNSRNKTFCEKYDLEFRTPAWTVIKEQILSENAEFSLEKVHDLGYRLAESITQLEGKKFGILKRKFGVNCGGYYKKLKYNETNIPPELHELLHSISKRYTQAAQWISNYLEIECDKDPNCPEEVFVDNPWYMVSDIDEIPFPKALALEKIEPSDVYELEETPSCRGGVSH